MVRYLETQFLTSLSGGRGDTGNHFVFLVKLLNTLLPMLGVALLIMLAGWRRGLLSVATKNHLGLALTFLLLALAGSVPLVVSSRQSMFYVLSSLPFYALAAALPVAAITSELVEGLRYHSRLLRFWQIAAGVLMVVTILFSATKVGTYNRDETMVRDVKAIGSYLQDELGLSAGQEYAVGACSLLWRDWGLDVNLARYHHMAMASDDSTMPFVVVVDDCANDLGPNYVPVLLETSLYHLYARRKGVPDELVASPDGGP